MSTSSTPVFLARTAPEPPAGAVVMLEGSTGTAYQRLFSTSNWHSTTNPGVPRRWSELQAKAERRGAQPILLIHLPADEPNPATAEQLHEAARLIADTGAPVTLTPSMSRADVAALLLTLRAYAESK